MNVWLDNTGLQAGFKAIWGTASGEHDVRGLLQLGTYLVFAERLLVNGFEPNEIASRTRDSRDVLAELTESEEVLSIVPVNELFYGQACAQAARKAAEDLVHAFSIVEHDVRSLEPPDLPRSVKSAQTSYLKAALENPPVGRLETLAKSAFEEKAAGAVAFMLAVDAKLRKAVIQIVRRGSWSKRHTEQLNALLRGYLNQELGGNHGARYAPSLGRALIMQQQNQEILDALTYSVPRELARSLDSLVEKLRGRPLAVPAVSAALVTRSKGEPRAVLREALKLRKEAEPLRNWLHARTSQADLDSPDGRWRVSLAVEELRELTEQHLRLKKGERLTSEGALKLMLAVLAGGLKALGRSSVVDWVSGAVRGKKAIVLSDLARTAGFPVSETRDYAALVKNALGKN